MQIWFLSKRWMITLFFILWFIFQGLAAIICSKIPTQYFSINNFFFKERKWEKGGAIYVTIFHIQKWKRFLPDGGAITKGGYRKKHLSDYSKVNLERFLIESCRAELTHLIAFLPFWIFGLFAPPITIFLMFVYAFLINFPCVITQRYNRHRLVRVLNKTKYDSNSKL